MNPLSLAHTVRPPSVAAGTAGSRPPLLILLHGVGSNEQSMAALAPAFDPRFVVISVRSPLVLGPSAYAWFHVTFTAQGPVIDAEEAAAGWTRIASLIDEAVTAYDADPARVYVAGFSQGAIMALAAMLTAPERIAGAVAISGRLLPEVLPHAVSPQRLRGKPVLIVHGTLDEKLGVHFARSARERLEPMQLALTYRELPIGHAITQHCLDEVARWLSAQLAR